METILAIINVLQRIGTQKLLVRIIVNVVTILGLVITTAIMISATLIFGLMHAHLALVNYDVSPFLALIYVGCAALFIIAFLIAMIAWRLRCLRKTPHTLFGQSPLAANVLDAFTAFTDGLMAK